MRNETGDKINKVIADNIRKWRLKQGLSQEELAARIGYEKAATSGKTTISRLERGDNYFIVERLIPISVALGVPFNELFRGIDEYTDIFNSDLAAELSIKTLLTEEELECLNLFRRLGNVRRYKAIAHLRDLVELEEAAEAKQTDGEK